VFSSLNFITQFNVVNIIFPYTTVLWIRFLFLVFQILCRDCS